MFDRVSKLISFHF